MYGVLSPDGVQTSLISAALEIESKAAYLRKLRHVAFAGETGVDSVHRSRQCQSSTSIWPTVIWNQLCFPEEKIKAYIWVVECNQVTKINTYLILRGMALSHLWSIDLCIFAFYLPNIVIPYCNFTIISVYSVHITCVACLTIHEEVSLCCFSWGFPHQNWGFKDRRFRVL